jgi:CRP-like cAMP-binding protein
MNMQSGNPVKERVIMTLLILNEKYKKTGKSGLPTVINLSRENMAAFADTTVETLVRTLRALKDEGILTTQGRKVMIQDLQQLQNLL